MSTQPEFLFGNPSSNGPVFTILSTDGISSSSLMVDTNGIVSFTGSFPVSMSYAVNSVMPSTSISASYSTTTLSSSYVDFMAIGGKPALVSASAQINYAQIASIPSGIVSSSAQLPAGIVSSSAQVFVGSTVYSSSAQLPAGLVSASAQVLNGLGVYSSSVQLPAGLVSSSAQVILDLVGTNIVSSSAQVLVGSTVVSSSVQFSAASIFNVGQVTASFTGSLTGALTGTASWSAQAATASYVVTANTASYVTFTNVANKPLGLVSSSAQVLVGSTVWSSSAQLPAGVISASAQVLVGSGIYSSSVQLPAGLVSSSAQVLVGSTVVSSSAQFTAASLFNVGQVTASFTGSLTGALTGTASWATRAVTASYVDLSTVSSVGYSYLNKTTTQPITSANTFQSLPFDVNSVTDTNDWTYSNGASTLTCLVAAGYSIDATVYLQKASGIATVGGARLTKNGVEIAGSFISYNFASNNVVQALAIQAYGTFAVNDILAVQIIGGGTNIQAAPVPSVGTPVSRPSATLRVVRA